MSKIILASASPRRKEIMELMGLTFEVRPSHCEERITETDPEKMVMELSRQKALDVAATCDAGDIVIGSDTIVVLNRKILGKPRSREHAYEMLSDVSGRTHHVFTGVTVLKLGDGQTTETGCRTTDKSERIEKSTTFAECTEVHVAEISDGEIEAYLDMEEYSDKAGAYAIQGRFAPYITGINGDYYNVMGLPAARLYQQLKHFREEQ